MYIPGTIINLFTTILPHEYQKLDQIHGTERYAYPQVDNIYILIYESLEST